MEARNACDIREVRPTEAADALALFDGGPTAATLARRLSVGAFDPSDGTLRGAAVNETLSNRGCAVHLHCADPDLGRALLDRALSKAAAAGRRASQVTLHPASIADTIWVESSWPVRRAAAGVAVKRETETEVEPEAELETAIETATDSQTQTQPQAQAEPAPTAAAESEDGSEPAVATANATATDETVTTA